MSDSTVDVVIVGAGFSGMYLLSRMRALGFSVRVFERGDDVGGTWYWNRYPGARCDVDSMQYSYSFDEALQQEWRWPEKFSAQPDILTYARHVAERFDLRRDITFSTRVVSADFDESTAKWWVTTDDDERIGARFVVMATGCISTAQIPLIPGASEYCGGVYHTGEWPHAPVDFSGQRIAVIGTGSSGIQAIPVLAREAAHVTVFQRTANYSLPARNETMRAEYEGEWKNGVRDGLGKFTFARQDSYYVGEFKQNQLEGKGQFRYSDGTCYKGRFQANQRHGFGMSTWPDGSVFVGFWKDGKKDGLGRMKTSQGVAFTDLWRKGKRPAGAANAQPISETIPSSKDIVVPK